MIKYRGLVHTIQFMPKKPEINYMLLRKINPEAARTAVLEYLSSSNGNISKTAGVFGIQRLTIYDIIRKSQTGNLKDQSKAPKKVANKTAVEIEKKIISLRLRTGFGAKKLVKNLAKNYQIIIPLGTLKGILRRAQVR